MRATIAQVALASYYIHDIYLYIILCTLPIIPTYYNIKIYCIYGTRLAIMLYSVGAGGA